MAKDARHQPRPTRLLLFAALLLSILGNGWYHVAVVAARTLQQGRCDQFRHTCGTGSHASPKPSQQCYDSFEIDCQCDPGCYMTNSGRCDPTGGGYPPPGGDRGGVGYCDQFRYTCGTGSHASPKPGQQCYDSFEIDCQCDPGYYMANGGRCDPTGGGYPPPGGDRGGVGYCDQFRYTCGTGSHASPKPGQQCYDSFEIDCKCEPGYYMAKGGRCEPTGGGHNPPPGGDRGGVGYCDQFRYTCGMGSHASPKPGQQCYDSFEIDCKCDPGYYMANGGRCEPTGGGHNPPPGGDHGGGGYCDQFRYTCGMGSHASPKPGQQCYDSFAIDCECESGYLMRNGRCDPTDGVVDLVVVPAEVVTMAPVVDMV
eukprot:jgi/Tetstr1/422636/TSEL_013442.t1